MHIYKIQSIRASSSTYINKLVMQQNVQSIKMPPQPQVHTNRHLSAVAFYVIYEISPTRNTLDMFFIALLTEAFNTLSKKHMCCDWMKTNTKIRHYWRKYLEAELWENINDLHLGVKGEQICEHHSKSCKNSCLQVKLSLFVAVNRNYEDKMEYLKRRRRAMELKSWTRNKNKNAVLQLDTQHERRILVHRLRARNCPPPT